MDKFMKALATYFKDFFKSRAVGYWIFIGTAVLAVVGSAVYYALFRDISLLRYYSPSAAIIPVAVGIVSIVLSLVRPLSRWMPVMLFIAEFCSLCQFANGSYMYLSSIFYGGVTAEALASIGAGYSVPVFIFLVVCILCVVTAFLRHEKPAKEVQAAAEAPAEA